MRATDLNARATDSNARATDSNARATGARRATPGRLRPRAGCVVVVVDVERVLGELVELGHGGRITHRHRPDVTHRNRGSSGLNPVEQLKPPLISKIPGSISTDAARTGSS